MHVTTDQTPAITVVIPTHNRAKMLRRCLRALASQEFTGNFEVVVVLDGCSDESAQVVADSSAGLQVRGIEQGQQGPGAARNRGAAVARGAAVLFIDDDIVLAAGAVRAHAEAQARTPALVIGSIDTVALRRGMPSRSVGFWKAVKRRHESGLPPTFLDVFTGNLSVPTDAFRNIGGFDERLRRSEDIELGYRLTRAGLPVCYAGGARATQGFTKSTEQVLRDAEGYGRANVTLWEAYPQMRPFLHIGGVTSGIGLRSRLLPVIAGWPLPMALFRLLGAIPDRVPGTGTLSTWSQAYWRVRGVRGAVADNDAWRRMTARLRVLRYPAFAGDGHGDAEAVSRTAFEQQLRSLRTSGLEVATLRQYVQRLSSDSPPEQDTVVLTLDAPLDELREVAFPALQSAGVPATAFLDETEWSFNGIPAEVEVGLRGLPAEAACARQRLSSKIGREVTSFAYPTGRPGPAERADIRGAGFEVACVSRPGINGWRTDPFFLPRVTVTGRTTPDEFRWMLRFGSPPGRAAKVLSRLLR